eukprot:g17261.t1
MAHAMRLLGDREEARDTVQDTWVEIIRGLKSLRDPRAFPAWATRIATRRCASLIKAKQRQRDVKSAVLAETEEAMEEESTASLEMLEMRRAIASLPPDHAATIALFYLDDMSIAEVAIALDIPETIMTKEQMSRLDQMIEQALTKEDEQLLASTRELGYFDLGLSQFTGKLGWVTWVIMALQITMFALAAWCGYRFFQATDALVALKWGLPCAVLAIMALQVKLSLVPQMQADRIIREVKRVELMLAARQKRRTASGPAVPCESRNHFSQGSTIWA